MTIDKAKIEWGTKTLEEIVIEIHGAEEPEWSGGATITPERAQEVAQTILDEIIAPNVMRMLQSAWDTSKLAAIMALTGPPGEDGFRILPRNPYAPEGEGREWTAEDFRYFQHADHPEHGASARVRPNADRPWIVPGEVGYMWKDDAYMAENGWNPR